LNGLALDDPRIIEVAQLTGADVPVCVNSAGCVMTGVGEALEPLSLPKMPCVMVNPGVPVATSAVSRRSDYAMVNCGSASPMCCCRTAGRTRKQSLEEWVEALAASSNDLEAPAMRVEPVIGKVIAALNATNGAWLARMSGSGATCFAIYENTAKPAVRRKNSGAITPDGGCMRER